MTQAPRGRPRELAQTPTAQSPSSGGDKLGLFVQSSVMSTLHVDDADPDSVAYPRGYPFAFSQSAPLATRWRRARRM